MPKQPLFAGDPVLVVVDIQSDCMVPGGDHRSSTAPRPAGTPLAAERAQVLAEVAA
jgi:hypothetical protein